MPAPSHNQALATTSELDTRSVEDAIRIVSSCFSHADCKNDIQKVYSNYVAGIRQMKSFGQDVELLRYEALCLGSRVVGAGGIYRVTGESPQVTWLGWLGIEPSLQGRGLGSNLLRRLITIAENQGAQELKVYTPVHLDEYARCRAVYAHLGFIHQPENDFTCSVQGEQVVEHLLVKPLSQPPALDLADLSFRPHQ